MVKHHDETMVSLQETVTVISGLLEKSWFGGLPSDRSTSMANCSGDFPLPCLGTGWYILYYVPDIPTWHHYGYMYHMIHNIMFVYVLYQLESFAVSIIRHFQPNFIMVTELILMINHTTQRRLIKPWTMVLIFHPDY